MKFEHVRLLQIERDLHDIPRGTERFQAYLTAMSDGEGDLRYPPMAAMNPMGREHVSARLDELIALGAEGAAEEALREAESLLPEPDIKLKHGLCICDDLKGGWTNRYTTEASLVFQKPQAYKRPWITSLLWVSEEPNPGHIREDVLRSAARASYVLRFGEARTLGRILAQEGFVASVAQTECLLDADDLEYSREVLSPLLSVDDYPTMFAALFGDEAAKVVGYRPLGLSHRAGFAVAAAFYAAPDLPQVAREELEYAASAVRSRT